mmetsp:Transcript_334/g.1313  ORF Transcript_334/g.1313 Transcript_334/m.1313 type:complete len:290 (-) Transcript_334:229-1098(-)
MRLSPFGAKHRAFCCASLGKLPCRGNTFSGLTSVRVSFVRNARTTSSISRAPGRNTKMSPPSLPGCSSSARRTAAQVAFSNSNRPLPGAPRYSVRTGNARPSLAIRGAGVETVFDLSSPTPASRDPSNAAVFGPTSPNVADITTSLKSGRSAFRTSVQRAKHKSASRLRSWNSSNTTAATPSRPGSSCNRRARIPSVTTSIRVSLLTLRSNRTRYPTVSPTLSPRISAIRIAAARAASRRGSSTKIEPPFPNQIGRESSIASGSVVVFPAPGGACNTKDVPSRSVSRHW